MDYLVRYSILDSGKVSPAISIFRFRPKPSRFKTPIFENSRFQSTRGPDSVSLSLAVYQTSVGPLALYPLQIRVSF